MKHEIYIFSEELDTQQNFFLTKVLQRHRCSSEHTCAYVSRQELKSILGSRLFKQRLEAIIRMGFLDVVEFAKNRYGNTMYGYVPLKTTYTRHKTNHKMIKNYYQNKHSSLSKIAKKVYKNISNADVGMFYEQFMEVYGEKFKEKKRGVGLTEYMDYANDTWDAIIDWKSMNKTERVEYVTEDEFGNRLHSLFSRLPKKVRSSIKLWGESTVEIDLQQSQPTLLAQLLYKSIGSNSLYECVKSGDDVYYRLSSDREKGKKMVYYTLFGSKTPKQVKEVFPDIWDEINRLKWQRVDTNPSNKKYSNLAHQLQQLESNLFRGLWSELLKQDIPFIPVHDSVIVRSRDLTKATNIMSKYLSYNLPYCNLSIG